MQFIWQIYWYFFGTRLTKSWHKLAVMQGESEIKDNKLFMTYEFPDGFRIRVMAVHMGSTTINVLYIIDGNNILLQTDMIFGIARYDWEVTEIEYGSWMWKYRKQLLPPV